MKKFLSLLLALTLVLSLVVVPARAHDGEVTVSGLNIAASDVERGTQKSFTLAGTPTVSDNSVNATEARITSYSWTVPNFTGNPGTTAQTATLTAATPTTGNNKVKVSCTVSIEYTLPAAEEHGTPTTKTVTETVESGEFSITNKLLPTDITKVTFNGREYSVTDGSVNIVLLGSESLANGPWTAIATNGYTIDNGASSANKPSYTEGTGLTVKTTDATPLSTTITVTHTDATVSATATPNTVLSEGTTTLTATSNLSSEATYRWFTKSGTTETPITNGTVKSFSWKVPKVDSDTPYQVICKAYEKGQTEASATSSEIPVTVKKNDFTLSVSTNPAATYNTITLSTVGTAATITSTLKGSDNKEVQTDVTYGYDVSGNTSAIVPSNANTRTMTATLRSGGTISVTPYATYMGKKITATPITISGSLLEATLSSTYYGANNGYYTSESLKNYANEALKLSLSSYDYVTSVVIDTASGSRNANGLGQFSNVYNDRITFTPYVNSFGKATFTASVRTYRGLNYTVTFAIPVTPVPVNSFDSQTAEPISTSSVNTSYKVSAPSGYTKFYVLGNSNSLTASQTVDYSRYSASQLNSMGYTYTTIPSTYFSTSGQCTLYVIAWNDTTTSSSYSKYYCGPMTVTQTNYNINYNGVAGETVQFAQSDFTDFMNEVAEARGDASKTKSYPYVTFDYVTFSLPTTAQGTLYYGGTAMSTSNSSGAFNTRTKVTNLDSVTFVPNAKTTAKTITLNFTLYAKRYSNTSSTSGTTVSYSGSVVVNLVREDIKYTVSQGDSVRFDESDFLSYLRSTKGYTSNYTIDYVTFDQSAVSAVNEGSLYTYYNGYNYGGSVKTTDRFYYNATASQNALSDVAFLASRYAKTGETVYIPFTIYARYGTTGTGTRQLTGTVAIKIGQTMNFIDVKTTDYFYNSVKWAVGKNITNGTSSTTFSPYKSCTRAEIVTFLWRAAGSPEPTITRNPFRDVNAVTHSSYYKAILWASQKGITSGTSATAFSPDQVCTRAQIVTFLYRYAGQPSGYYSNPFKDVSATSEASYYNAVLWAVGKGITTGTSATTFSPYASCNRAEAVTFLYRYTNGL